MTFLLIFEGSFPSPTTCDLDQSVVHRNAAAIMIMVAYGLQIGGNDDPIVLQLKAALQLGFTLSTPGKYLVEFMPICRSGVSRSLSQIS